jgi:hypothetical protein
MKNLLARADEWFLKILRPPGKREKQHTTPAL